MVQILHISPGRDRDFLGVIYISQEVELLPGGYKYCPGNCSGMGYIDPLGANC